MGSNSAARNLMALAGTQTGFSACFGKVMRFDVSRTRKRVLWGSRELWRGHTRQRK